jgi:hypothetical protein
MSSKKRWLFLKRGHSTRTCPLVRGGCITASWIILLIEAIIRSCVLSVQIIFVPITTQDIQFLSAFLVALLTWFNVVVVTNIVNHLMQPPLFRGHSELTITNLSGTGRWNYLDLDKLKHRKLSLVCLGFTSMNVPPMLKCPIAFRHFQMSGVAFGGHVPWVLCSVYLD